MKYLSMVVVLAALLTLPASAQIVALETGVACSLNWDQTTAPTAVLHVCTVNGQTVTSGSTVLEQLPKLLGQTIVVSTLSGGISINLSRAGATAPLHVMAMINGEEVLSQDFPLPQ